MGRAEMKVPGGKLLRAVSTIKDGKIEEVRITGDFFMHPEEAIDELERQLKGVSSDEATVRGVVEVFFKSVAPTVLGASPKDFAEVILKSISEAASQ